MATVECRSAAHIYNFDVIMDDAVSSLSLMRDAGMDPTDAMRGIKMGPADDDRPLPPRRRRRVSRANPRHPDIRELYRYYLETGMSADDFAAHLGCSRQSVWGWFNNVHYPDAATRAQIKARTGIVIGPPPPNVDAHVRRADFTVSRAQEKLARNRAATANAKATKGRVRSDIARHR